MEIFGKDIKIRSHYCKFYQDEERKIEQPYVMMYVKFKGCNANCLFCEYKSDALKFNEEKYFEIINELKEKIWIKKISFSGGEPTLQLDTLKRVMRKTRLLSPETFMVVNTNGVNLKEVFEDRSFVSVVDNFAISRHHWDDDKNNDIFGTETISSEDILSLRKNIRRKKIFHMSCDLIKGYIDSKEEVINFLEYANHMKIKSIGFVSLMPINDFCKQHFVDFNDLDLLNENFRKTQQWTYEDICRCSNYIYIPKDYKRIINVYTKNTYKPFDVDINLSFDGENLRNGFNGDIIY